MPREVAISGFTPDEILALSDADLAELVFCDEPLLFRIGSAEVLGGIPVYHRKERVEPGRSGTSDP